MHFTVKELQNHLGITKMALSNSLKGVPCESKKVEGSAKPVRHYSFEDLPERVKETLKDKGVVLDEEPNSVKLAFTQKYLLASPEKQEQAQLKCKLIELYKKRKTTLNQKKWLKKTLFDYVEFDKLGEVSIKQLNDWLRKYNIAKNAKRNVIEEFIDARGAAKGIKALTEEQKNTAVRYFLKATRPVMMEVHRNMTHMYGNDMASYDTLNNFYKEWQHANPVLNEFSKNPDSAKNKYLAAFGDESEKAKYRNQYWELDSTPADVICSDGKRYTILAALDIYSRRVVFHVAESSSSFSIAQLLRKAILKLGIPENVVIDNGRDYTSNHFNSICTNLGIDMQIVPPFSGECKPHVERVFGTLSRELFEQIPGYIGHNVSQRTEIQARQSFAQKIESQRKWREQYKQKTKEERKAWADAWKLKKENRGLNLTVLLNPDELQMWCNNWVDKIYEQRTHKGIKTTPVNKWNKSKMAVKSIPNERMLDLLLGESHMRKVGKKGISFDGCLYMHLNIVEYIGHSVYIMAPDEMGYILVYNLDFEFICIAEDAEFMGQRRSVVRDARKKSKQLMQQMNRIVEQALAIDDVTIMDRIEAVSDKVETTTYAVTKHTKTVDMLLEGSKTIIQNDKEELEKSKRYDFKKRDEEGKPTKVLPSGRPVFNSPFERFVWVLENDCWNDKDEVFKEKHPEIYEMALKEIKGA